ncbi:helix-turn-helix transcriptional regulator [Paenibacillus larvae]|uniref:Transcriptional regulator-like protein n=3 Tax=Paenibacillus larvae TaxID=1464 RepID=A0A2L1UB46_9BACL|nr:helix-turn-helix transcriptional regulator [Paenibacillus larvae]AQR78041.1 transcriptional regulator [Paenibacillus larvae subsp. larvae]AQT85926.1 transcriptional regulator [Paenibacillus larvae subsp. pulvifaciens]AQZ45835.1 transcriptional regulator [Paenibacillus larvae subsp. pulvifaciens]ARF69245.1 transcriptional regulator [Paenibacillus larvae subsp. pulvifaciens]AVF20789.1 transcriptional regulator-like protein [Paenibacillus larvae subsp. larvae]
MRNNIKNLRKTLCISQDELAKHCNVTRQTINAIENNKYSPSLVLAFRIAEKLNTNIEKVFIKDI